MFLKMDTKQVYEVSLSNVLQGPGIGRHSKCFTLRFHQCRISWVRNHESVGDTRVGRKLCLTARNMARTLVGDTMGSGESSWRCHKKTSGDTKSQLSNGARCWGNWTATCPSFTPNLKLTRRTLGFFRSGSQEVSRLLTTCNLLHHPAPTEEREVEVCPVKRLLSVPLFSQFYSSDSLLSLHLFNTLTSYMTFVKCFRLLLLS